MNKVKNALYFGDFFPFHNGHMGVIKDSLRHCDYIDLYVSNREKNINMTLEERKNAIRSAILKIGLSDKVSVLDNLDSLFQIDTSNYKGPIITGSDIAIKVFSKSKKKTFFTDFSEIIVSIREEFPLCKDIHNSLFENFAKVTLLNSDFNISATAIREKINQQLPYEQYVPNGVAEYIN